MREIFPSVFEDEAKRLLTRNLAKGASVYGEELVELEGVEYRVWDPFRSKLSASIMKGLADLPITGGSKVLYLGAASGTTVSHVSDIIGKEGIVFAVEVAFRPMRSLLEKVATKRHNVVPILADARDNFSYTKFMEEVDCVYSDVAQPDQTEILLANAKAFIRPRGHIMMAIKASSIDSVKPPGQIYEQEVRKLEDSAIGVIQRLDLDPFDRAHQMILGEWTD